jgi:hypothetical protein
MPMADAGPDVVIWGITQQGGKFRPSDWAERLAGVTSAFGYDQKVVYSPLVEPMTIHGVSAVIVGCELETMELRLYQFLLNFARDNDLQQTFVAGALNDPRQLVPPTMASTVSEPREPV